MPQLFFTKAAAQRILSFATKIEDLKTFKNSIQITYCTQHGRCSTFLSKHAFYFDFFAFRQEGAKGCLVKPPMAGCYQTDYEVRSNRGEDTYTVRVTGPFAWCRCPDYKKQDQELGKAMPGCKHVLATLAYLGHGSLVDFVSARTAEIEQKRASIEQAKQQAAKTIAASEVKEGDIIKHFNGDIWQVQTTPEQTPQGMRLEVILHENYLFGNNPQFVYFQPNWRFELLGSGVAVVNA